MKQAFLYAAAMMLLGSLTACDKAEPPAKAQAPEVGVMTVETSMIHPVRNMVGHTVSSLQAEVRPQVRGIVREVLFTEGGMVREGDVLYRIEPETYQAAYNSARAALAKAEANLESTRLKADRATDLRKANAVSQQSDEDARAAWRQAKADVEACRASLDKAAIDLKRTEIVAPISGSIGKSTVTAGALITESQTAPLATIFCMDPMYVDVPLTAEEMRTLRKATNELTTNDVAVRIQLGDGSWYEHNGKLRFTDVSVNPETGSILCRAEFPNPDRDLLPGLYVNVKGTTEQPVPGLLIPQKAIQRDGRGDPFVMIVDDKDIVERRPVSTGRTMGDQWQIRSGLAVGERIVVDGILKAKAGAKVAATLLAPKVSPELADNIPDPATAHAGDVAESSAKLSPSTLSQASGATGNMAERQSQKMRS